MYPNQEPPQNQYPIDYLNQIAPAPQKAGPSRKLLMIIGGGVLLIIIVAIMALVRSGTSNVDRLTQLAAKMQTLQTISQNANQTIKDTGLRSTNGSLTIFLTNANRDVLTQIDAAGGNSKNLNKTIVASENGDQLTAELENYRLLGTYDRNYARLMDTQLSTVAVMLQDINARTNRASLKEFLKQTYDNLKPISQQLEDFNKVEPGDY